MHLSITSASESCWEFHGRSWWPLNKMAGTDSELLNHIKSRKLRYFGHIMRLPHDNSEGSGMTGLVEGTRNCGRPRTCWIDNIVAWTDQSGADLLHIARDRGRWSALTHPLSQPSQSDDGEVTWHDMHLSIKLNKYNITQRWKWQHFVQICSYNVLLFVAGQTTGEWIYIFRTD